MFTNQLQPGRATLGEAPRRAVLGMVSERSARGTGQLSRMSPPRPSAPWGWPSFAGRLRQGCGAGAVWVESLLLHRHGETAFSMRKEGVSSGGLRRRLSLSQNGDTGTVDTAPLGGDTWPPTVLWLLLTASALWLLGQ